MSLSFTWDDYVKIGYNGEWFRTRSTVDDEFTFSFRPVTRKNYGFNEEAIITAAILEEKIGIDNIAILYSGGIDSEFVVKSFLLHGKVPELIFLDFGTNTYDLEKANSFARNFNLNLRTLPFDLRDLHESGEALDLCIRYQSSQSGYAPYLKAIQELGSTKYLILGDDPVFERIGLPGDSRWNYCVREHTFSWWKAFFMNGNKGCPNFILFSPDLFSAYVSTRRMQWLFGQDSLLSSTSVKGDIFREAMGISRRIKMTGTEHNLDLISSTNKKIYEIGDLCLPDTKYVSLDAVNEAYKTVG